MSISSLIYLAGEWSGEAHGIRYASQCYWKADTYPARIKWRELKNAISDGTPGAEDAFRTWKEERAKWVEESRKASDYPQLPWFLGNTLTNHVAIERAPSVVQPFGRTVQIKDWRGQGAEARGVSSKALGDHVYFH